METGIARNGHLDRLRSGLAAVVGAPNMFAAARALAKCTAGTRIILARYRVQNRFTGDGRTLRRIMFTISMFATITPDELRAWIEQNPLFENARLPPGWQPVSSDLQIENGGQELSAVIEMVEAPFALPEQKRIG